MRILLLVVALLLPLTANARLRSYNVQRLKACTEELAQVSSVDPERLNRAYAVQCDNDPECMERRAELSRDAKRIVDVVKPDLQREIDEAESEGKLRKLVRVSDEAHRVCACARTAGAVEFPKCVTETD